MYYYNGSGDTYQGWQNSSIDASSTPGFSISCGGGTATITADFTSNVELDYKTISGPSGGGSKWKFGSEIHGHNGIRDPITWDHHSETVSWEDSTREYTNGQSETVGNVTNHYLSLMGPDVDLVVFDGASDNKLVEDESQGNLEYDTGTTGYLAFLHITENEIEIELK